jgi:A/G-specific adenine glycosylase
LRALPGIGAYTAAAVAAIAFGRAATPVDGNIERVTARLFAIRRALPAAKADIRAAAASLTPDLRAGDFAQAMMDLGATICTPRAPKCLICPWQARCRAAALGIADALPARRAKPPRPVRHAVAFWIADARGHVLLRRRPEQGLLGGMMEVPSTPWREAPWNDSEARRHAPGRATWRALPVPVRHGFTHFEIVFNVWVARARLRPSGPGLWWPADRLAEQALPTAMKKIARAALGAGAS